VGYTSDVDEGADSDDEGGPEQHPTADLPTDSGEVFAQVMSGDFDANTEPDAAAQVEPERRVLAPDADAPKLHKVLAQAGIGSRRDMEELIEQGRITVNAQVAHTGQRILRGDQIRIDGKPVRVQIAPPPTRVLAYHKPAGEVVTHDDPQNRPTVFRKLPRLSQGKWQSVGRLDINTEGLLLFTNSGELANQLMHPRFGVEREYAVRVLGTLVDEQREMLLEGVDIDGQMASFRSIEDGGGEGVNHWYRVVITEGRNREVRRLFEAVDMAVSRLIRIRYGCVVLPRGLKRGVWVDLADEDVRALRRLTGLSEQRQGQRGTREGGNQGRNGRRGGRDQGGVYRNGETGRGERSQQREPGEGGAIPNPLQQTYDKRAIREARQPRRDIPEDGPIPNPLEQTYDKRFVQKPRGSGGGKRGGGGENQKQPDPMQTSVGYIGADAFHRKIAGGGGGRGGRGNRGRGR
jgi:23S rRNA pseudouridine2605 synthase